LVEESGIVVDGMLSFFRLTRIRLHASVSGAVVLASSSFGAAWIRAQMVYGILVSAYPGNDTIFESDVDISANSVRYLYV
jgi:hypothetical protein